MNKKEFEEFTKEMLPIIEKIIEVAGKYNLDNELISLACSVDGYIDLTNHKFSGNAYRIRTGGDVVILEWGAVVEDVFM